MATGIPALDNPTAGGTPTFNGPTLPSGGGRTGIDALDNPSSVSDAPALPAVPAATSKPSGKGGGGFLSRLAGGALRSVKGVPAGLTALGGDIAHAGISGAENVANDVAYGATLGHLGGINSKHLGGPSEVPNASPNDTSGSHLHVFGSGQERAQELNQFPVFRGIVRGYKQTGNEVAHPSQLVHNYAKDPVGSLLNDAFNVASIAAPASEVLHGAAGVLPEGSLAARAAEAGARGATTVGAVGGAVAKAPVEPYTFGLAKLGSPLLARAAETKAGQGIADTVARARQNAEFRRFYSENLTGPKIQSAGEIVGAEAQAAKLLPHPDEQAALTLTQRNEFGLLKPALDKMSEARRADLFSRVFDPTRPELAGVDPSRIPSPAAAEMAYKYAAGKLDPETAARIANASSIIGERVLAPREASALAGTGRVGAPMSVEQTGFHPLSAGVAGDVAKPADLLVRTQKAATALSENAGKARAAAELAGINGASPFEQGMKEATARLVERASKVAERRAGAASDRFSTALAQSQESLSNTPARLRPMRTAATRGIEAIQQMAAEATASGDHAGADALSKMAAEVPTTLASIREQGLNAQHLIGTTAADKTAGRALTVPPPSQAELETLRKTGGERVRAGNLTRVDLPGQAKLEVQRANEAIHNQFADKTVSEFGVKPAQFGREGFAGAKLAEAMRQDGYVAFNPKLGFTRGAVPDEQVTGATAFLPKSLFDTFAKYEADRYNGPGFKAYDKLTRLVYKDPLQLSPTYHLRIALSNLLSAHAAGGLSAADIAKYGFEAAKAMRDGTAPRGALRGGLFADERAFADEGHVQPGGTVRQAARSVRNAGYRVSAWIDNASRTMVALEKMGKEGMAEPDAVATANRVIGDFNNMSPFERGIVRRAFPIYGWVRHLTGVALRYAADNPTRAIFLAHVGDMVAKNEKDRPGFLNDYLKLGDGRFLDARNLNPLSLFSAPPGPFLNPILKASAELGAGVNPSNLLTGRPLELTRPPTVPQHGPIRNTGEAGFLLSKLVPLVRDIQGARLANVKRYGTGEPKLTKFGKVQPSGLPGEPLLTRLAGIPLPEKVDVASMKRKAAKAALTQRRQAARYKALSRR